MLSPRERLDRLNNLLEKGGNNCKIKYEKVLKGTREKEAYVLEVGNGNVAPVIYCDDDWYTQPDRDVVTFILNIAEKNIPPISHPEKYTKEQYIRDHVYPKLVSGELKHSLEMHEVVCKEYLDMCLTYYVRINLEDDTMSSYRMTQNILKNTDITEDELRKYAVRNMEKEYGCRPLSSVLSALIGQNDTCEEKKEIYVLTSKSGIHGAAAMLCPKAIKTLTSSIGPDFYILPSSIHEVLAVPLAMGTDPIGLKEMVGNVNISVVDADDILSWSVYICHNGCIEIAA